MQVDPTQQGNRIKTSPFYSVGSTSLSTIPLELLNLIFHSLLNQRNSHFYIHSFLLTSRAWSRICEQNHCVRTCQIAFNVLKQNFPMDHDFTGDFEKICKKEPFTSEEFKLLDRVLKPCPNFTKFLNYRSGLFKTDSIFLSLLHRYSWKIEEVEKSQDSEIKKIAEDQLITLKAIASHCPSDPLEGLQHHLIKRYRGMYNNSYSQQAKAVVKLYVGLLTKSQDYNICLSLVHDYGTEVFDLNPDLKKNKQIILAAIEKNGFVLGCADENLKKDQEVVLAAIQQDGQAFQHAHESLKKNKEFVLAAVQIDGHAFRFADENLQKDKEIVLATVQQNGFILMYMNESFKQDKQVVLSAIQTQSQALLYACDSLKDDPEIMVAAAQKNR